MTVRLVTEEEFRQQLIFKLDHEPVVNELGIGSVTGPGRSGAMAAVYVSHIMGVPFIPYKSKVPTHLGRLLIVDTARETGATMRKAMRYYEDCNPIELVVFEEPPRVAFWYEAEKPQRYRHERKDCGCPGEGPCGSRTCWRNRDD